jgi:signal transduction histidine kinase
VLEVAQPLGFVQQEMARVGTRYLLNTLTLLLTVALLTLFLVRRFVSRPMERFVEATRAVGRGELRHRLAATGRGELAELGEEFNRMAGQLDGARTQLLRQTEDRVALERRLRESEKMASIGKLSAGLAHEIAAPLNVISGRAELVLRRTGLADEQRRSLRIIVDQIRRITTIVRNLLDFGRRREARRLRIDLADVVDGALQLLDTELAGADITVRRSPAVSAVIEGDPDHLHQVLVNLLLNATQAIGERPGERWVEVRLARGPATATVAVADSGPGIAAEARDRIFEPFFTTKPGGTGLGLVVSRSIAEELGGTLELDSEGPGAVFRLTLPLAPEPGAPHD